MLVKATFILLFFGIIYSLFRSLMNLIRSEGPTDMRVFKGLSWRIGLSIALFMLLLVLHMLGVVEFHGLKPV